MTFSSCLTNQDKVIVLDASVIINLLATGYATEILQALNVSLFVTVHVVREIEQGATSGRQESKLLDELIGARFLQIEELTGPSLEFFSQLVSGSTADTLGDGEAATLSFAYCSGFAAAIDEKKATRIAGERFGTTKLVTTIDILSHSRVRTLLGKQALANATFQALLVARMQVRRHQLDWVTQLIGENNLKACESLRRYTKGKLESNSAS